MPVAPSDLLNPVFWHGLYHGRFGIDAAPNTLLLVLARLLVVVAILLAARVAVGIIHRSVRRGVDAMAARAGASLPRLTTLCGILSSSLAYLVYFVAIVLILFNIGLNWAELTPLLGLASVLGLAVGFGAQKLVRDVITGLFILGEGQFDVGETVTIGTVTGRVEDMGLRITRLRDEQGRCYVVANGDITQVFNASRGRVRLPIEVNVQRETPLDRAVELLQRTAATVLAEGGVTETLPGCETSVLVVGMDAAKVTLRLVLWVPVGQREGLEDDIRRRLLTAIAESDVQLV